MRSNLEEKLEDLVTLLRTQHGVPAIAQSSPENRSVLTPSSIAASPVRDDHTSDGGLTVRDLSDFRSHLKYFPFICLPDDDSKSVVQGMKKEQPLLSQAIHTVCTKALSRQSLLAKQLRATLATQILVDGDRSLDLQLSMIVCIA